MRGEPQIAIAASVFERSIELLKQTLAFTAHSMDLFARTLSAYQQIHELRAGEFEAFGWREMELPIARLAGPLTG